MSAFGTGMDVEGGPSLAVRLMQVAGEYEVGVKKERQKFEMRIAGLSERNEQLERQARVQAAEADGLTKQVAKLSADMERLQGAQEERLRALELELVQARFALHDRSKQLQDVLRAHRAAPAGGISDENATALAPVRQGADASLAAAVAASLGGSSIEGALEELEGELKASQPFCRASLLAAAEHGREALVQSILQPSRSLLGNSTGGGSGSAAAAADGGALVKAGSAAAAATTRTLSEALLRACSGGHLPVVKRLLAMGAGLGGRSTDGQLRNPLHAAAGAGQDHVVKFLLGHRDVGVPKEGFTPLIHVDDSDAFQRTAMHLAAAGNFAEVVKLLLLNGADPTLPDICGLTPADIARGTRDLPAAAAAAEATLAASKGGAAVAGKRPTAAEAAAAAAEASRLRYVRAGLLPVNGPAPAVYRVLHDASVVFWNASVRANRHYSDKRFEAAIAAYSIALDLVVKANMVRYAAAAGCVRAGLRV
jgi:ankyrin repeat protein